MSLKLDGDRIVFPNGSILTSATLGGGGGGPVSWNDLLDKPTGNDGDFLKLQSGEWVASVATTVIQLGSVSGTINTDASLGNIFDLTITSSGTLANPNNPTNGQTLRWRIVHGGSGIPISLDTSFKIPSTATSPLPFSTASGVMDILGATYHAVRDKWDIVAFVPGY